MKKLYRVLTMVVIALMALSVPLGGQTTFAAPGEQAAAPATEKAFNSLYVVQMIDQPIVAYEGGVAGLKATAPKEGKKVNVLDKDVIAYGDYLKGRHNGALAAAGGGRKVYDYTFSYNGFAAELTADQAAKVASAEGVLAVSPNELFNIDTSSTPAFLGLTDPGGLWDMLGGVGSAGEGVVIGIVDSGIWPESLSFSDRLGNKGNTKNNGRLSYQQIPGWNAKCVPGEEFNASNCNQKLIGAQYFNAGWGGNAGIDAQRPWEFNSARDYNGHGTHTASTAGGNYGVMPTGPAAVFGAISGIAPRARISAYKALWSTEDGSTAGGTTVDLVAAIDQAVADGVDVINYSISGSLTNFADPAEIAFLFAARAGVFVAASAGNSGPTTSTVAHPSPWVTTVAAGTHNRSGEGSVTLGNGVTYFGASLATAVGPAPFIDSVNAGIDGADPTAVALCFAAADNGGVAVLDPAKVAGKIVLCDRGVTARVNKSLAVQKAGGVGMVLVNASVSSINADFHFVPTVHLQSTDRAAVKAYAATAGATATINQAMVTYTAPAPFTASFSSRGPLRAGGGDLLKPDVIAPGQDILAAVAPPANAGRDFNLYSGTSMSSPHVAGLAALLKDLHPTWSPMMIKSAMMTSASDILDGPNTHQLVIFRQGAGHIHPNSAADPGLVFNSGWNNWLAFLCGTTTAVGPSTCATLAGLGYSLDASDMNVASIAIGDMAGSQTVTRRVTNVGSAAETYTFSYTGMAGFTIAVNPASFSVAPGASQSFTVTFTRTTAPLNAYTGGQFTFTGDLGHVVRIPMVVRPVAMSAPASVFGTGDPISYPVIFGYDGPFTATARGLVAPVINAGVIADDPTDTFSPRTGDPSVLAFDFTVPAGTTFTRFSLFDADVNPGSDLDLYIYLNGTQVGLSGSGTSAEEVNLVNPAAGTYTAYVHGWGVAGTTPFALYTWLLDSTAAGNMAVSAPTTAVLSQTGTIDLTFSGLLPATKYLGSVAYDGVAGMPNPTIVRVDTP